MNRPLGIKRKHTQSLGQSKSSGTHIPKQRSENVKALILVSRSPALAGIFVLMVYIGLATAAEINPMRAAIWSFMLVVGCLLGEWGSYLILDIIRMKKDGEDGDGKENRQVFISIASAET